LEYIGLGPHTDFFIGSSTSYGSTANYLTTNYIMTTGEEIHLDIPDEAEFYTTFLDPKNMDHAVEITFAALIQVLLSLRDVFNENLKNYGITTDNRFSFIDHLPGVNGPFDFYDPKNAGEYSPRDHLNKLMKDKKGKSNLLDLKSLYENEGENFDEELNRKVNDRLFRGIPEKGFLSLESAINKANEDITSILEKNEDFTENINFDIKINEVLVSLIGDNEFKNKKLRNYERKEILLLELINYSYK